VEKNSLWSVIMNYYFTGTLIILLVLMALFLEPGYR